MLSAVAVRKAARAAKAGTVPGEARRDAATKPVASAAKRKPSVPTNAQVTHKNKRKKLTDECYYGQNSSIQLPGRVPRDDTRRDDVWTRTPISGGESSEEKDVQLVVEETEAGDRTPYRAWSPGQPRLDSSGDEFDSGLAVDTGQLRSRDSSYRSVQKFSFVPQENKNVFRAVVVNGVIGTLLVLKEEETTAVLGVYALTLLRGSLSILGTSLYTPSSHMVFAPKCSPVPILTAYHRENAEDNTALLPEAIQRVLSPDDNVIFFRELFTGVEGLQKICRTFDGVFDIDALGSDILGLQGARLVSTCPLSTFCICLIYITAYFLTSFPIVSLDTSFLASPS